FPNNAERSRTSPHQPAASTGAEHTSPHTSRPIQLPLHFTHQQSFAHFTAAAVPGFCD
ncbi:unnamed protein product, partial [Phaeothamnion confervicola]